MTVETNQLRLLAYAPQHLLALIEGIPQFEALTGLRGAEGLRDGFVSDEVSPAWLKGLRAATNTAPDPWAYGFGVLHRESGLVIGTVGFKGAPDNQGAVEIAYGIVPSFQRRGYATEAAKAGVAFAFDDQRVRLVRAHTLSTNIASHRVLEKCGFANMGEVIDPEDGLVWRWERVNERSQ